MFEYTNLNTTVKSTISRFKWMKLKSAIKKRINLYS